MDPIKPIICSDCGKLFIPTEGQTICPTCQEESGKPKEPDLSVYDPNIEDVDDEYNEDPEYDLDDNDTDPFELDLDDELDNTDN